MIMVPNSTIACWRTGAEPKLSNAIYCIDGFIFPPLCIRVRSFCITRSHKTQCYTCSKISWPRFITIIESGSNVLMLIAGRALYHPAPYIEANALMHQLLRIHSVEPRNRMVVAGRYGGRHFLEDGGVKHNNTFGVVSCLARNLKDVGVA